MPRKNSVYDPRRCVVCGRLFFPTNSNQICCSKECSYEHNKQQKKDRRRAKIHYGISYKSTGNNMKDIANIVKDDPHYGLRVAVIEGKISDKNLRRITEKSLEIFEEVMEELRY